MDRQLFSQANGVSGRRTSAVPVSIALHVMAIGGAVLASAAMMPPLPAVEAVSVNVPVILPPEPVRVMVPTPPPPKGQPNVTPRQPRTEATQPAATPAAVLPNADNIADLTELDDHSEPASLTDNTGPKSGGPCVGCASGPVGELSGKPGSDGPVRVSGLDAPTRIHFVKPVYPGPAIAARIQGRVIVDCTIGPDGKVYEVRVLEGNVLLRQPALDAVRQWRYTRPRLNDTPISVLLTVTVDFQLR
jgi:periplasmic protein TonB